MLFSAIEIANFDFKLETFKKTKILLKMIASEWLKTVSLIFFIPIIKFINNFYVFFFKWIFYDVLVVVIILRLLD